MEKFNFTIFKKYYLDFQERICRFHEKVFIGYRLKVFIGFPRLPVGLPYIQNINHRSKLIIVVSLINNLTYSKLKIVLKIILKGREYYDKLKQQT